MTARIDGLEALQANIAKIAKQQVPKATAKAINRVARKAMRESVKQVSSKLAVPTKLIRKRAQLRQKATAKQPFARIRVNISNLPLIRLLESPQHKFWEGHGAIMVGQYAVKRGFKQRLKNGRTHIMQREGKARYRIDVVKIPLAQPLTDAFHQTLNGYENQIELELKKSLSQYFSQKG